MSGSFSTPASLLAARTTTMLCVEIIRLLATFGRLFDSNELTRTFRADALVFPLLRNFGESIGVKIDSFFFCLIGLRIYIQDALCIIHLQSAYRYTICMANLNRNKH